MLGRTIAGVLALMAATAAFAQKLEIGDKAPDLGGKVTWLKGAEIPAFEVGQVYVLDFWATWCGPCVQSIPHVDELSKRYRDKGVHVIGVAVWPEGGGARTAEFVKAQGDKISYAIADDLEGAVERAYLRPTKTQSIPTAMIVDRAGALAWIGHPADGMDEALEKIVAGNWDPKRNATITAKADPLLAKAQELAAQGKWDDAMVLIDQVIALDPEMYGPLAVKKYTVLHARLSRFDDAKAYGRQIVRGVLKDNPQALNGLAWFIVDDSLPITDRDADLALEAAEAANKLTKGADFAILDTLAAAQFLHGEVAAAVKTQRRAIELAPSQEAREDLGKRLAKYESSAAKG